MGKGLAVLVLLLALGSVRAASPSECSKQRGTIFLDTAYAKAAGLEANEAGWLGLPNIFSYKGSVRNTVEYQRIFRIFLDFRYLLVSFELGQDTSSQYDIVIRYTADDLFKIGGDCKGPPCKNCIYLRAISNKNDIKAADDIIAMVEQLGVLRTSPNKTGSREFQYLEYKSLYGTILYFIIHLPDLSNEPKTSALEEAVYDLVKSVMKDRDPDALFLKRWNERIAERKGKK